MAYGLRTAALPSDDDQHLEAGADEARERLFARSNKAPPGDDAQKDRKTGQLQVERDFLAGQPAISRLLRGRPMIAPNAWLSVNRQYRLLRIARSSFYYQPQPTSAEELDLLNRLDRIFAASGNSKFRFRG